ncbi:hypothetical protein K505DRAFT_146829 [Melanomma pulvis-pyrius CBS 109.77]|uniref:Uncharacterized protein n=1 Tax=Melanomma pulvis-pyrius CBS 109.77 TaxID=1314802 RepID=A0A6A6XM40_9PLEO|nr:hypothetical protein K505DRAFT_146829 [Melanomma pulvis-pyrius CBS 109.77]
MKIGCWIGWVGRPMDFAFPGLCSRLQFGTGKRRWREDSRVLIYCGTAAVQHLSFACPCLVEFGVGIHSLASAVGL